MNEKGIYRIPLALPPSFESQRKNFEETILDAQRRLKRFALAHDWGVHVEESFVDRAEIFEDKQILAR